jgi:hypothetical protein
MFRKATTDSIECSSTLLSRNLLPNHRHLLKITAAGVFACGAANLAAETLPQPEYIQSSQKESVRAPQDTLELLKLVVQKYGNGIKISELFPKKTASKTGKEVSVDNNHDNKAQGPTECNTVVVLSSVGRTYGFLSSITNYISCYQQEIKDSKTKDIDCNDHSRAAGDFCAKLGLASYHISICPKNWTDRFRVDSHQFHAAKLSDKLFLFFDHSNEMTIWHGSLNEFIGQYRVDDKPVCLIPLIGITRHAVWPGNNPIKCIANHFMQSVNSEDEMVSLNLKHTPACVRFLKER